MRGSRARRPSHATVVAYIALFVALGGTALATHPGGQNTISTGDIQNGQVKTDDIGNGEVKVADIGQGAVGADELVANSVGASEIAAGAVRTDELQNGQVQAEDLAPGVAPGASGARAWGLVASGGALVRSKNVTGVTHPDEGIYCIDPGSGIDPTTAVMMVGEDFGLFNGTEGDNVSHVEWDSTPSDCPAGTMQVLTLVGDGSQGSGGEIDLGGFDLVQLNQPFTFVIP
jgi:hypothetical protein